MNGRYLYITVFRNGESSACWHTDMTFTNFRYTTGLNKVYLKIDGASFLMIHGIKDVVRVAAQVGWGIE